MEYFKEKHFFFQLFSNFFEKKKKAWGKKKTKDLEKSKKGGGDC